MNVYICFIHYYNGCDEFSYVEKVFANVKDAVMWVAGVHPTEVSWRSYKAVLVE